MALPYARQWISHPLIADVTAGAVVFIVVLVIAAFIGSAISASAKMSRLSFVNHVRGFGLGVLRGAILVCLAYLPLSWTFPGGELPEWAGDAQTRPFLKAGSKFLAELAPTAFVEMGAQTIGDFKDAIGIGKKVDNKLERANIFEK